MEKDNEGYSAEEAAINPDEVEKILYNAIESNLDGEEFNESKVQIWIDGVCASSVKSLVELHKSYKYIVNCIIMQKCGAGLHTAASCYWDCINDGLVTVKWPREKQRVTDNGMQCIVTSFATAV
eukprot:snap_masked-scaffold_7-processed-gene-5.20-mRNA-1 protein AED:0.09 eAED:0.09 QI:0/0/0/1/1/1/3/0/123